jgi:uncharacterized protein DUF1579
MSSLKYAALGVVVLLVSGGAQAQDLRPADPSKTTYGERNPKAPKELSVFSFIVGKWQGTMKTRLPNGTTVSGIPVSWIGRYILDGTAIADEAHSVYPDGRPALGISLRQYDARRKTWIVEFLNVSESFLRKQVNAKSGSVTVSGRNVTVRGEGPGISVREHYLVADADHFVYRADVSTDGGRTWDEGQVEMSLHREERP